MKHTIKILFLFIFLSGTTNSYAQTHTFKAGWCRYAKKDKGSVKGEVASFQCAACDNENKKEEDAKKIEDKRRADIAAANYKAKEAALKKAADLKRAEDLKNANSGEVFINGNVNPEIKSASNIPIEDKIIVKSKKDNSGSKLHAINASGYIYTTGDAYPLGLIINEVGDTIIASDKFYPVDWFIATDRKEELKNDIPKNVIIVEEMFFSERSSSSGYNVSHHKGFNLMNAKGAFLLTEKTINYMKYLGNDFFIFYYMNQADESFLQYYYGYYKGQGENIVLYDHKLNKKYNYLNSMHGLIGGQKCQGENCITRFVIGKEQYQIGSDRIPYKSN